MGLCNLDDLIAAAGALQPVDLQAHELTDNGCLLCQSLRRQS